jgi:hypothetical protein
MAPSSSLHLALACVLVLILATVRHDLNGWTAYYIWADVLHVIYIGVGKAWACSAAVFLAEGGYFGQGNLKTQLRNAFGLFKAYARANKQPLSIHAFHLSDRAKNKKKFPEFRGKAADYKIMIGWLAVFTVDLPTDAIGVDAPGALAVLTTSAFCLANYANLLDESPMFLSDDQANQAVRLADDFLLCLTELRRDAILRGKKLFNITPKRASYQH